MDAFAAPRRYQELRAELREVLAQARRWNELPRLMDRLDRARRGADDDGAGPPPGAQRELLWVDRFAGALLDGRPPAGRAEQVRRTAQALWPWLGAHDPVAVARGRWDALPRSYA
ncbi:hypothetical protein [Piscinibacter defluvii]|uniref:hypothetical protein n=1 Tax=Piscinibacter defluvii TaxID=1796922 RepID=UPI000FDDCFD7|nr:hypothetical protein [Piscinibacter defluvii]